MIKIWKDFFEAAKGRAVVLIIPGVWNENDPLKLGADNWRVTEDVLIYDDDGEDAWIPLEAIRFGRIRAPEQE